ncbi:MAG: T9SS type A sorting domain-containing protein [Bacteroidetes bacterium]|nr:T9SS type A sorting domain-containing protein [Bacteroidota bacterium]
MKRTFILSLAFLLGMVGIAQQNDPFKCPYKINGQLQPDSLICKLSNNLFLVDARHFMESAGGEYYPFPDLFNVFGFATQYGKIISYARAYYDTGFYNSKPVFMIPPVEKISYEGRSLYAAPLGFLSRAIGDTLFYNSSDNLLEVYTSPPDTIGSIFTGASNVARVFQDEGFLVRQAAISYTNAITLCNAGYVPNCNGNNANFPYFLINMPPSPVCDTAFTITALYNMRNDEAIITMGYTPPECKYYSYRSYMVNRFFALPEPIRLKIYASLGDTRNLYNMNTSVPLSERFERPFAIISAADSIIAYHAREIILNNTGIPGEDIHFDIIPYELFNFGFNIFADWGNFLHRASIFKDEVAGQNYIHHPSLEVLRITPSSPATPQFFAFPPLKSRLSGTNEFYLLDDFYDMEQSIYQKYAPNYDITLLGPSVWLVEGYEALQKRIDVLGETRDALYIRTDAFNFHEDDIIIVYGVNHTKTGKAVYTNVSCYHDTLFAGYGGIKNMQLEKTAREYFQDTLTADYFFTYKFVRHAINGDPHVFVVPADTFHNMLGLDIGRTAFMGFRAYIDTTTLVGPSATELIMSRAMLLRPSGSGFEDVDNNHNLTFEIFPNPGKELIYFMIDTPEEIEMEICVYNASGQLVAQPVHSLSMMGKHQVEWKVPAGLQTGNYFARMVYYRTTGNYFNIITRKLILN